MAAKRDPGEGRPVKTIGDEAVMTTRQLADHSPIGEKTILTAFESGDLEGRRIGGPTGWVTTWGAFCAWVKRGNHDAAAKTDDKKDGAS